MTQIDRHPLIEQAYNVCLAIEECGASVELTNAVTKASALMLDLDKFIPVMPPEFKDLQPHQQRAAVERAELDSKIEKLSAFFSTSIYAELDAMNQELLTAQLGAMREYSDILSQRIDHIRVK